MSGANKLLQAASGGAKGDRIYVEDVFSTHLYDGESSTSTTITINNGLDLSDKGGLLWTKSRGGAYSHYLIDSERGHGTGAILSSNASNAASNSSFNTAFTSTGYTMNGGYDGFSQSSTSYGSPYVSWAFAKQAGFFDIQTWTGNGSNRTISHDLGCVPAFIIVKRTSSAEDWTCYHVGVPGTANYIQLNKTDAYASNPAVFQNTAPTSSVFSIGENARVNTNGETYVAYLFAGTGDSDSQIFGDGSDEAIIKCGSFTLDGSGNPASVNLGFEPQWLMVKRTDSSTAGNWYMEDMMRGIPVTGNGAQLYANTSGAESASNIAYPNATGFTWNIGIPNYAGIYVAIRRPMKTPQYGTDVFSPYGYSDAGLTSGSGTASNRTIINGGSNGGSGFPVDVFMHKTRTTSTYGFHVFDRLRGKGKSLLTNSTSAEPAGDGASNGGFAFQEGVDVEYNGEMYFYTSGAGGRSHITYHLRRATGFMDAVAYTGNGTAGRTVSHNLGSTPEFIIVKRRDSSDGWTCYVGSLGATKWMSLNQTATPYTSSSRWNDTAPTDSVFTVGTDTSVNGNTKTYIAYLFATLAGVSKVGTYTGSGSSQTINCGFSSSARLVLIRKTSSTGNWLIFDSVRGITVGATDGTLTLDTNTQDYTEQQFFSSDVIQPDNTGFKVLSSASLINDSGADYLFLAIA